MIDHIKALDCPLGHSAHVSKIMGEDQWLVHCWKKKTPTEHAHGIDHMFLYSISRGGGVLEWNDLVRFAHQEEHD